jgi:hypothetical protein
VASAIPLSSAPGWSNDGLKSVSYGLVGPVLSRNVTPIKASRKFLHRYYFFAQGIRFMNCHKLKYEVVAWSVIVVLMMDWTALRARSEEPELVGHWQLHGDSQDRSAAQRHAQNHGAQWSAKGAKFDGLDDWLEVPSSESGRLGSDDFTVALWAAAETEADDRPGDLVSCYDPVTRCGFHLSLKTNEVVTSRANSRNLHFGVDQNRIEDHWTDHGRVGHATFVFGLAVHRGQLFAATCEPDLGQAGHVYRWGSDGRWIDCGVPAKCNSVSALITFQGKLYAGTGKYRLAGSALKESENLELGGQIYRYESDGNWTACGQLPNTEAIGGMAVFRGHLYAGSLYRPAGFFRYDGEQKWTSLATPGGKRVEAMCVHNGQLFASGYDEAHVYRFDGQQWTDCGQVGDSTNTQTYSFALHHGRIYVGTWRTGKVFRYDGDNQWTDCGRLGEELEVMGMLVHNGRLLAGSLPLAGVFQYEGDEKWSLLERVDLTPNVMYRRAWTMAEYRGRVFVGTLPSGHVLSNRVGINVTHDEEFPSGWHHIAARRAGKKLCLFVDGNRVAESTEFEPKDYDLSTPAPLKIGLGSSDYFHGELRDVRLYRGALTDDAVRILAQQKE